MDIIGRFSTLTMGTKGFPPEEDLNEFFTEL